MTVRSAEDHGLQLGGFLDRRRLRLTLRDAVRGELDRRALHERMRGRRPADAPVDDLNRAGRRHLRTYVSRVANEGRYRLVGYQLVENVGADVLGQPSAAWQAVVTPMPAHLRPGRPAPTPVCVSPRSPHRPAGARPRRVRCTRRPTAGGTGDDPPPPAALTRNSPGSAPGLCSSTFTSSLTGKDVGRATPYQRQ
jgi:hypothetical protein